MPIFDRACECGWKKADCYEPSVCELACPDCGKPTVREWTSAVSVHGDDKFIGGRTFENLGHEPVTVYSRSELKREMEKRGLQPFVRHQPEQGSDKSKHTSRWV